MAQAVTVINVSGYNVGDVIRFRIGISKPVVGITVKNGEFIESEVQHIDFVPEVLTAKLYAVSPKLLLFGQYKRSRALVRGERFVFDPFILHGLLVNAIIEIERTRFDAGDEYQTSDGETHTHENVGYNTEILSVQLTAEVERRIDLLTETIWS